MGLSRYLLTSLLALQVWGKKDKPSIAARSFHSRPVGLHYFPSSEVVFVSDADKLVTYRSEDAGVKWEPLNGPKEGEVMELVYHPYDHNTVVFIGIKHEHWISKDKGKTWKKWESKEVPSIRRAAIIFHAADPDRMIFMTEKADGWGSMITAFYTTDGFETEPKLLKEDVDSCIWAKSSPLFTTGNEQLDKDQILCIVKPDSSSFKSDYELRSSSDFFKTKGEEPSMGQEGTVSGMINIASVKKYLVAAAKSEGTSELAMYVSDDAKVWHRAEFGDQKLEQDSYTLLESTNYSLQVDVQTSRTTPMGILLTSNSNGTFFRTNIEHTNRNLAGYIDFENIQNIQGIALVNVVDNWEDVAHKFLTTKKLKTKISFDDGRPDSWKSLKFKDEDLHLHSVSTSKANVGAIFSSPAPGIVMGVGNTGDYLKDWEEGDTFVSDDAGLTWKKALDEPHLYEFGDQGAIIVAIEDTVTDKIKWSINHGKDWKELKLKDLDIDEKIRPTVLTTTHDSTSLKFILIAKKGKGSKTEHVLYALDFSDLHERKCEKGDFEDWWTRVDDKGEPTCIMGHKQKFRRRKADADCFVDKDLEIPEPSEEDCKCTDQDYECDYAAGFVWNSEEKKCVPNGPIPVPEGECKDGEGSFNGPSGYQLVPGNTCTKNGGVVLDEPNDKKCSDASKGERPSGKISVEITGKFQAEHFDEYYYLERGSKVRGDDETVIMRTDRREVFISHDHGKKWEQIEAVGKDEVVAVYPHQYHNDAVYLITPSKKVYYSHNRGKDWDWFEAPEAPSQEGLQILQFHPDPKNRDWLIWTGAQGNGRDSKTISYVTQKGGITESSWEVLLKGVRKCQFVYSEKRTDSDSLILCEQHENENPSQPRNLVSSTDFFKHKEVVREDIVQFATMAEFIVVAMHDENQDLKVDASIDGKQFADAQFPPNFNVTHQQGYTVLDSETHAIFLHVTVNPRQDQEYGTIIKSNSNGTSYVLSVGEVNRNGAGYVDFEKMQGLEGVAVINRVSNREEVDGGKSKKLKTYITHNDGADWALIPAPQKPLEHKDFSCSGPVEDCSLHLHGYTERKDVRDTFSSASAVGLMIANGNVGDFLGLKKDADTFATRDGGVTWHAIAEGNWMWEFGDQGSIVVIVQENEPTKMIRYSLDEGQTWKEYEFADAVMQVNDITTVPSDSSRQFLLWGKIKGELVTVNIDFSGIEERSKPCNYDDNNVGSQQSDYEFWTPKHPLSDDDCLFGHVAQYHRKKLDAQCYNGEVKDIQHQHDIKQTCECTRRDYECDYNYERRPDGSCALIDGQEKPDAKAICKAEPDRVEYFETTGYRRIPLTTCKGGQELELTSGSKPCPGKEEDYEKKHGISGAGIFFAIVIPIGAAAAVGYWVFRNWDGKFGRIRLGGEGMGLSGGRHGPFDRDAPWIKYPVMALSGIAAVVMALPMVASTIWSALSSRLGLGGSRGAYERPYTSRSSFARGRGDYAIVDPDEGELFGDESDEEA
ncbi:Hypothetical protein R9X50_00293700 [Acrodontium crateriforme]|uniref:Vacuolar protein sorting/targeting protein 10 n=1 Tax=Acrodontium crateriforme TaxID=150365 RepID=A0AAQ3M2J6_9PEZI|nr:Hypothetical protein R9X50_00293700 [Acrodontium crateriforme]